MPFPTRKAALAAAAAFGLLALAACGGGGGGGAAPQTSRVTLPEGHSVASGSFSVPAGRSVERGGVRFSCAAGGTTCAVVVDPGSGQARVTGGRLTVARIQAATPAPQPASVTLPQGHSVASGSFSVPAGRSVERGGVRFSCAAGGAACAVAVDAGSGQARVTGGRLTVARVQAAQPGDGGPDGGQGGGMEEADWPFPDWPIADVTSGGGTLPWSPSEIHNRIRALQDRGYAGYRGYAGFGSVAGSVFAFSCTDQSAGLSRSDFESWCNVEYQPVMTYLHGGIPIVQARALDTNFLDLGADDRPGEEIAIGGILDHGYFLVARQRGNIGRDSEGEHIGAKTYVLQHEDSLEVVSTGRWEGALIGTGNSATSPLYRQFIIGDVDVTVDLGTSRIGDTYHRDIDVAFSNVRNINTRTPVTLSHTQWNFSNYCCKGPNNFSSGPGRMDMEFRGPNDEEVFGNFTTEEAVGAFGAKKQ